MPYSSPASSPASDESSEHRLEGPERSSRRAGWVRCAACGSLQDVHGRDTPDETCRICRRMYLVTVVQHASGHTLFTGH
jgi:hypothetical protein